MIELNWLELLILALASFRLTHLIVYDDIMEFLRNPFISVSYTTDDQGTIIRETSIQGTGIRYWIGTLLSCHWCTGIWCAMAVVAVYYYIPVLNPILVMLSVAGIAALIESYLLRRL